MSELTTGRGGRWCGFAILCALGLAAGAEGLAGCSNEPRNLWGESPLPGYTSSNGVLKGTVRVTIPEGGTPEIYLGSLPVGKGRELQVELGVPATGTRTLFAQVPGSPFVWANQLANSHGEVAATGGELRIDARTTAAWLIQASPLLVSSGEVSAVLAKIIWETPELDDFAHWIESSPTPDWARSAEFKERYGVVLEAAVKRIESHADELSSVGKKPTSWSQFSGSLEVHKEVPFGSDLNYDMGERRAGNTLFLEPKAGGEWDWLEFTNLNVLNALVLVGEIDKQAVDTKALVAPDFTQVPAWPFKAGTRQYQLYQPTTMLDFIDVFGFFYDAVVENLGGLVGPETAELSFPTDRYGAYGVYFFSGALGGNAEFKHLAWKSFPSEMIRARASNLLKWVVQSLAAVGFDFGDEVLMERVSSAFHSRLSSIGPGWQTMTLTEFYSLFGELTKLAAKVAKDYAVEYEIEKAFGEAAAEFFANSVDLFGKLSAAPTSFGIFTQMAGGTPLESETFLVGGWNGCASSHDCSKGKVCQTSSSECILSGCANGILEPGESCDGDCPLSCNDSDKCTVDALVGNAAQCSLVCSHTQISACKSGDTCCPKGCTAANDGDCPTSCGNGIIEGNETCDKNCPSACPANIGCTSYALIGSSSQCTAECKPTTITACGAKDGCCPNGCNSSGDQDCTASIAVTSPAGGTSWNHGASFKATWSAKGLNPPLRVVALKGVAEQSPVILADAPLSGSQSVVVPGTWSPGSDYRICVTGNNGNALGCSGMFSIAPAPSITISNPTPGAVWKIGSTYQAAWDSVSVTAPLRLSMYHGGAELPPIISTTSPVKGTQSITVPQSWSAAAGYSFCVASSAQGVKTCSGPITISADIPCSGISSCISGDGCCPSGCSKLTDQDCAAICGNSAVEPGELCDGNCPSSCGDGNACTKDSSTGSAISCNLKCNNAPITSCVSLDGCCPAGCNKVSDSDCSASCGNGTIEPGETCDGNCPSSCNDNIACTKDQLAGSAQTCNAVCSNTPITTCMSGDACCPAACTKNNDADCSATCGNGVVELGEACDSNCPTSCNDGNACTQNLLTGSAQNCSSVCSFPPITACLSADGCCPPGCDASKDNDCTSVCGNGVVEPGETCDGSCPSSCNDGNYCTVDGLSGSAQSCTAQCTHSLITSCQQGDGCCPPGCTNPSDGDCPVTIQCGDGICSNPSESCPSNCSQDCCSKFEGFSQTRPCTLLSNGQSTGFSGDVQNLTETNAALDSFKICASGGSLVLTQTSSSWPIGNYGAQTYTKFSGLSAGTSMTFHMSFACQSGGHVVAVTGSSGGEKIVSCVGGLQVQSIAMPATVGADGTWSASIGLGKASDTVTIDFLAVSIP